MTAEEWLFLHKRNMQSTKNDLKKKRKKKKVAWKESSEHHILFFFKSKQQDRVLLFCQQVLQMKQQNELFVLPCHIEVFHDLTPLSTVRHHLSVPSKKVTNHCLKKEMNHLYDVTMSFSRWGLGRQISLLGSGKEVWVEMTISSRLGELWPLLKRLLSSFLGGPFVFVKFNLNLTQICSAPFS